MMELAPSDSLAGLAPPVSGRGSRVEISINAGGFKIFILCYNTCMNEIYAPEKQTTKKTTNFALVFVLLATVAFLFIWVQGANKKTSPAPATTVQTTQANAIENDAFHLTINKLGVNAPIMRGADPTSETSYNRILQKGVAHMVGTAMPGEEKGNIFIYGHSSAYDNPQYGKIFATLNNLQKGDAVEIYYQDKNYQYEVSGKKVVEEDDLSVLEKTGKEQVTLMTCWPIGTSEKRLVVIAERVQDLENKSAEQKSSPLKNS